MEEIDSMRMKICRAWLTDVIRTSMRSGLHQCLLLACQAFFSRPPLKRQFLLSIITTYLQASEQTVKVVSISMDRFQFFDRQMVGILKFQIQRLQRDQGCHRFQGPQTSISTNMKLKPASQFGPTRTDYQFIPRQLPPESQPCTRQKEIEHQLHLKGESLRQSRLNPFSMSARAFVKMTSRTLMKSVFRIQPSFILTPVNLMAVCIR